MEDLIFASATGLAQAIRSKEVSSVEVVKACLDHIEALNPKLNAVVQLTAQAALKQAGEADQALAQEGPKGPLHGVPMTIKDSFDTAGVVSTWGTPGRVNYIPDQDATVVARLKAARAILVGKTNAPEFTLSYETDNPIYGRTNNPYNLERTSGDSTTPWRATGYQSSEAGGKGTSSKPDGATSWTGSLELNYNLPFVLDSTSPRPASL